METEESTFELLNSDLEGLQFVRNGSLESETTDSGSYSAPQQSQREVRDDGGNSITFPLEWSTQTGEEEAAAVTSASFDWSGRSYCHCDHDSAIRIQRFPFYQLRVNSHIDDLSNKDLSQMDLSHDATGKSSTSADKNIDLDLGREVKLTCSTCVCSLKNQYGILNSLCDLQVQLLDAIRHHDIPVVQDLLLNKKVDPNFEMKTKSPICQATALGNIEILTLLLNSNADPNTPNSSDMLWKRQPVHIASSKGHLSALQLLLKSGANINQVDNDQRTPLHWVSMYGQAHMITWMLAHGANVNVAQTDGFTPLHTATCLGHKEVCRLLIDGGADISKKDKDGWNSLHTAVCYGYTDIVKLLLIKGANPFARTNANNDSTLHIACSKGRVDVIDILLQHGVPIEDCNNYGSTPLHTAVYYCRVQATYHLIKAGANVNTKNYTGSWAVYLAAIRGEVQTLQLLLSAGCSIRRGMSVPLVQQFQSLATHMEIMAAQPQTLKEMCLLTVRHQMAPHLQTNAHRLPLPPSIIRTLVLEDLTLEKVWSQQEGFLTDSDGQGSSHPLTDLFQ